MDIPPSAFLDPSTAVFFSSGASRTPRRRGREATNVAAPVAVTLLQPPPQPMLVSLAELHSQVPSPLVSTGLHLALEEQLQKNLQSNDLLISSPSSSSSVLSSTLISDELAAQVDQQKDEMDRFLQTQGEQLRRALAERHQRHYRALLAAAEEVASRRLREKNAEVERAARRGAELEDRLARLRADTMAWQSKALAEQSAAAAIYAQLQKAAVGKAAECVGESAPADDAESAHVDTERVEPSRACRGCGFRLATVVLFPCRHLCLCDACEAAACPACSCARTGSVQVFLS